MPTKRTLCFSLCALLGIFMAAQPLMASPASPRFQWEVADAAPGSRVSRQPVPQEESLFSGDYWKLVGEDIGNTFTAPARWEQSDWLVAGSITAGVGLTMAFDKDIQHAIWRNRNGALTSVSNFVEPLGFEYAPGVLAAFYLGGEIFSDSKAKSVALDGLSASIIATGLILQPLKYGVGRNRPRDTRDAYSFQPFSGSDSFPSGHTTEAFAIASVISEHYDSPWVGVVSYSIADCIGYARVNHSAHWPSDVAAGAAIGALVGCAVVNFNKRYRNASLSLVIGPNMRGAQLSWAF